MQKRDAPLLIKLQLSDIMVKRLDRLGASKSQKLRELEELAKATRPNSGACSGERPRWTGKGREDTSELHGDLDA